jgi:hypothetical protein
MGVNVSKVRSLNLDRWPVSTVEVGWVLLCTTRSNSAAQFMKSMGNVVSNARYEKRIEESGVVKPVETSSKEQKGQYIVAKYVDRQFCETVAIPVAEAAKNAPSAIEGQSRSASVSSHSKMRRVVRSPWLTVSTHSPDQLDSGDQTPEEPNNAKKTLDEHGGIESPSELTPRTPYRETAITPNRDRGGALSRDGVKRGVMFQSSPYANFSAASKAIPAEKPLSQSM